MKLATKIGVFQLTDHRLRLVVVKTGSSTPKVLERFDEALPPLNEDPELALVEQATLIRSALKQMKHTPTVYMLNTPHSWSVMRLLSVPFKGAKKVRAALTFELEPYLAIPIDDLTINHSKVSEGDDKTEVFVIGLQRDPVLEQLALLTEAGYVIEGVGLDIIGLAALALDTVFRDSTPQALIVDHEDKSYLAIIYNRSLAYVQRISATHDDPNAWAQEIQNAIRAFQATSNSTVELTRIVCTHNNLPFESKSSLESRVSIPIVSEPLGESWAPESIMESDDSSTWLSMVGIGSAAAGGSIGVSFDPAGIAESIPSNPYKKHILAVTALILFTICTQLFVLHTKARNNVAEAERLGRMVWEEFALTYPNDPVAQGRPADDRGGAKSYDAMLQALEIEQESSANITPEMFSQPTLLDILKELSTHMPDSQVTVSEINISSRRNIMEIRVRGETKTADAFARMSQGLNQSPLLDIDQPSRTLINGNETFEFKAHLKDVTDNS
jgi:hypothetical protein